MTVKIKEDIWNLRCGSCGKDSLVKFKEALKNGCPSCGSGKYTIMHKDTLKNKNK
ncbi:hypothetical protein N9948_00730 [bacterium]|nr:hypothetical protein [bacterium]